MPARGPFPPVLCFDVESIGLHGEGYAVGWVLLDSYGNEASHGHAACDPTKASGADSDRAWVAANVPPIEVNCSTPQGVRRAFWSVWTQAKQDGAILVADCGWPVEARFLAAIVDDDPERCRWWGPYPLHDVASVRFGVDLDPLATVPRLPSEEPAHHPVADARQSARLFCEAMGWEPKVAPTTAPRVQ